VLSCRTCTRFAEDAWLSTADGSRAVCGSSGSGTAAVQCSGNAVLLSCCLEGVFHEHGDGHGSDAARNGCDGAAFGGYAGEIDIAGEAVARFFAGVFDAVDADIDDDDTVFDPIGLDHIGAAYGGDEDIGTAADGGEVFGSRMGDGDGGIGIFCHEEQSHGLADDHAATKDYGFGTIGIDASGGEEAH